MGRWVGSMGGVVVEYEYAVLWREKGIPHCGEKGWQEKRITCGVLWMFPKGLQVL
jgi:hypothetical protein